MINAQTIYQHRAEKYTLLEQKLIKKLRHLQNLRLYTAAVGFAVFVLTYRSGYLLLFWLSLICFTFSFLYLLKGHNKVLQILNHTTAVKQVNETGLQRLAAEWTTFADTGEEFRDENHRYLNDLDIFGKESLFQWIAAAHTGEGRKALSSILSNPVNDIKLMVSRQQAVFELGRKRWWRQRLQAYAKQISQKHKDMTKLLIWLQTPSTFYQQVIIIAIIRILPLLTAIFILLGFGIKLIPVQIPVLTLFLQFLMYYAGVVTLNKDLKTVAAFQKNISVYTTLLTHFEKARFQSAYLVTLQEKMRSKNGMPAHKQLQMLQTLTERISNRDNLFFIMINVLLLWDYQCMIDLEKWKKDSGHLCENWLQSIGEVEACSSLAIISHDYPHWAFPEFSAEPSVFAAKNLGHPLLTNKQVHNDLEINSLHSVLLITGSNMSGKSTLLRSAGINLVLAYAGAPVCASAFRCSILLLFTCMRVSDNLEKGISGFYAELLRIKEILAAASQGPQVLFLLDEIFKGTNSHDRHTGARMLIKKLYNLQAIGMVSTHDLELGILEQESGGRVVNYHFQEYYRDDQIHFDYKLKQGVSTTRNALYLMKLAGIDS